MSQETAAPVIPETRQPAGPSPLIGNGRSAAIEIRNLTRTYHIGAAALHALKNVSLTIDGGEYVAVVGTSGSGKSTLLNILGLLDRPTEGTYRIRKQDAGELTDCLGACGQSGCSCAGCVAWTWGGPSVGVQIVRSALHLRQRWTCRRPSACKFSLTMCQSCACPSILFPLCGCCRPGCSSWAPASITESGCVRLPAGGAYSACSRARMAISR